MYSCSEHEFSRLKNNEPVIIGQNCEIDSDAIFSGSAIIGDGCKIKSGATIGPNVSIGNNSEIGNCHIKNSIVMENCKINFKASISDSIIANNCEIIEHETITTQKQFLNNKTFLLGELSLIHI